MNLKYWVFLPFAATLLAGCHDGHRMSRVEILENQATERSAQAEAMVGKSKADLLDAFGAPESVLKLDEKTTVYKYDLTFGTLRRRRFVVGHQTNTIELTFDVFIKNGRVTRVDMGNVEEVRK